MQKGTGCSLGLILTHSVRYIFVRECGMTLEGAARQMKEDRRPVESRVKAIEILKGIRQQLEEIRRDLL